MQLLDGFKLSWCFIGIYVQQIELLSCYTNYADLLAYTDAPRTNELGTSKVCLNETFCAVCCSFNIKYNFFIFFNFKMLKLISKIQRKAKWNSIIYFIRNFTWEDASIPHYVVHFEMELLVLQWPYHAVILIIAIWPQAFTSLTNWFIQF